MSRDWTHYPCTIDDKKSMILMDLDPLIDCPREKFPICVVVSIALQHASREGVPHESESEQLATIRDALSSMLSDRHGAVHVGVATHGRHRDFYFYCGEDDVDDSVGMAMARFDDYDFRVFTELEPNWESYVEFLLPPEYRSMRERVREIFDGMHDAGDALTEERGMDHWCYFPHPSARDLFLGEVKELGFYVREESRREIAGLPFGVRISREDWVDIESLNLAVFRLMKLSKDFGGEYDGFETHVVQ